VYVPPGCMSSEGSSTPPSIGTTVQATSDKTGAPPDCSTLHFSEGAELKITQVRQHNGEWYATNTLPCGFPSAPQTGFNPNRVSTSKSLYDYDLNSPLLPLGGCTCAGALCEARMPASKPFPKRITYIIFRAQCSGSLRARLSEDTLYILYLR
jgi:hypothetical protein